MSLTTTYKSHREFRAWFKNIWPKVPIVLSNNIMVESKFGQGSSAVIGTAFDYLLRFKIKKLNHRRVRNDTWLSEAYYERIRAYEEVREAFSEEQFSHALIVKNIIKSARGKLKKYLSGDLELEDLCHDALMLTTIDVVMRTGMFHDQIGEINEIYIDELKGMIKVIDDNKFRVKKLAILNPDFGDASRLVGGADADLILDKSLLDIKTSKSLATKRKMFDQLVAYFMLSKIQGHYEIENIGIYFARFNELWSISVTELFSGIDINYCISSFADLALALRHKRLPPQP
ncbi:hypothetical protein [Acidiphilium sp.]|uniref:hypothetical protein n=1 Tax=Acidiphilium sp. TaxID=527 RepID=UPI002583E2A6|nr:hypothetical protein [Acidiphilium sp.]